MTKSKPKIVRFFSSSLTFFGRKDELILSNSSGWQSFWLHLNGIESKQVKCGNHMLNDFCLFFSFLRFDNFAFARQFACCCATNLMNSMDSIPISYQIREKYEKRNRFSSLATVKAIAKRTTNKFANGHFESSTEKEFVFHRFKFIVDFCLFRIQWQTFELNDYRPKSICVIRSIQHR